MDYPELFSHAHVDDVRRSDPQAAQRAIELVFSDADDSAGDASAR
ncbi:hypothetical protein [Gordonia sp. OPL2]|nr:hypothetical protein [Gordonia sp. OPL2]